MNAIAPTACFASSYAEARAAFLGTCAASGAAVTARRHPLAGPDGAPLFLDHAAPHPVNADYDGLYDALNPATLDEATVAIVVEFGTRDMLQVMLAVQADNSLHHHGSRDSAEGVAIAQRMRDAFFLKDDAWKEKVCIRADEAIGPALVGMAAFTPEQQT